MISSLEMRTKQAAMASSLLERVVFSRPKVEIRNSQTGETREAVREEDSDGVVFHADFEPFEESIFELLLDGEVTRVKPLPEISPSVDSVTIRWRVALGSPVTA